MNKLPKFDDSLLLRTDFANDAAWAELCAAAQAESGYGFRAYVDCIDDPSYGGLTVDQLVALASDGGYITFAFLADRRALTDPERPILVVDLHDEPGRTFRVIPAAMWIVENNLSIANADFEDYAGAVDADGVFRGFPDD